MVAGRTHDDATSASIGQLVTSIKDDLVGLMRDEVALAKAEVRDSVRSAVLGGALIAVAAALGVFAALLLSFALVYGVSALGITRGWSFLIVGGAYLLLAAILALAAKSRMSKVNGAPRARHRAENAVAALKPSPDGSRRL